MVLSILLLLADLMFFRVQVWTKSEKQYSIKSNAQQTRKERNGKGSFSKSTMAAVVEQEPYPQDAVAGPIYIDTQHEDFVHDAQMDFYGSKLATCSSDRTIKIYNVSETSYEIAAVITAHEGPVWKLSWAHPSFGVMLASCSFDGTVMIHREEQPSQWVVLHAAHGLHTSSVSGVAFAPHHHGLQVAAASADGRVSIQVHQADQMWEVTYLTDCSTGVNAVSWEDTSAGQAPRLVTAGCDGALRFWKNEDGTWELETTTEVVHKDMVRDVAWAPNLVPNESIVASCSEDKTVLIWTFDGENWKFSVMHEFQEPVWHVSWSVTGHLLAVSSGENTVTLWKKGLDNQWTQVETAEEISAQEQ